MTLQAELRWRLGASATAAQVEAAALGLARGVFGPVIGSELTAWAALASRDHDGERCGHPLRVVSTKRARHLTEMLGESEYVRSYVYCARCGRGYAPADRMLGIGAVAEAEQQAAVGEAERGEERVWVRRRRIRCKRRRRLGSPGKRRANAPGDPCGVWAAAWRQGAQRKAGKGSLLTGSVCERQGGPHKREGEVGP